MEADKKTEELFLAIGLEPKSVQQTLRNQKVTAKLLEVLTISKIQSCNKKIGNLLYSIATTLPAQLEPYKETLINYIASKKITNNHQLGIAFAYLKNLAETGKELDLVDFDKKIGVGQEVTEEDVKKIVWKLFEEKKEDLDKNRYTINITEYLKVLKDENPFAEPGSITKTFNSLLAERLGPMTEEDKKMKEDVKKKRSEKDKKLAKTAGKSVEENDDEEISEKRYDLSNLIARDLSSALNTPQLLEEHKKKTGGMLFTRFPPEPNGYLHIGHAKAMRFNFMIAKQNGGGCFLRFDDTNPEKESQEFIDSIIDNVKFMGYEPYQIRYSSEYFDQLYDFAVKLIKMGKAYGCEQTKDDIKACRVNCTPSPFRDRSIEENLAIFENMKNGKYDEGKMSLRLKIDPAHVNPTMRDPVIYRIKYVPHPHIGDKWCIYPLYDFTHGLSDSIEGISYSLCTLEFEIRRDLYYWILEQCEVYRPYVWEYSRLNISNTVLSKRRLQQLVAEKIVTGWDDPRMPTINGLRRKGYTPSAINMFCDLVSVTRRGNENIISLNLLEHCLRKDLDQNCVRTMAVLEPVPLSITNVGEMAEELKVSDFPKNPEKGSHSVLFTDKLFVELSDISLSEQDNFYGIMQDRLVCLKYANCVIKITKITSEGNTVKEVFAELVKNSNEKPKGHLHWISQKEAVECEVRLYDTLFLDYDPNVRENFLDGINPNNLIVRKNAKINKNLLGVKVEDKLQFERVGFFCVDKDSDFENKRIVFNRTVGLQEKEKEKKLK